MEWLKSHKGIFLLVSSQLCFSLFFIVVFQRSFYLYPTMPLFHMGMVVMIVGYMILLMGTLVQFDGFRMWRYSRYVLGGIPAALITIVTTLYIIDFAVHRMGAQNITYDVFFLYFIRLGDLAEILPVSAPWIYLFFVGLTTLIFIVSLRLSHTIHKGICDLFLPERPSSIFRDRLTSARSFVVIGLVSLSFIGFMLKYFNSGNYSRWRSEPIASFLVYWSPFSADPHRVAVGVKDKEIRAAYPKKLSFRKKNVVLIISDSMRSDHMQVYGYWRQTTPFLATMVDRGKIQRVKFAVATCPETACGVLSTLASRNYRSISDYNLKINELLWDQGYRVYYVLSGDQTHYEHFSWYFGSSLDSYFDGNDSRKYATADDQVIFEGFERIPEFSGEPAFIYFHLMSTHFLGVKNGMYNHYTPSNINADYMNLLKGQYSRDVLINRYDNGMLEADDVIRKIFLGLERKGYLGDSIVFIIGDHGEGLGEHKHFGHDRFVYQEDIRIPMLIYDSEGYRYANLEFASQLDVAPTIIDRLGLNIPSSWEGKSLLNQAIKSYSYQQTRGGPYIYAVLFREGMNIYKYIRWERNRDTGKVREELYELNSDPAELRDLLPSGDPELIQKMRTKTKEVFGPDAS